jgi:hypothetical protein
MLEKHRITAGFIWRENMDALVGTRNSDQVAQEWAKSPINFTVTDRVTADIALEIDHPMVRRVNGETSFALVLGEDRYVAKDSIGYKGAIVKMDGGRALIRRAQVAYHLSASMIKTPLFRRIETENPKFVLAHVQYGFRKVRTERGYENLWAGVQGGKMISRGDAETLVELKEGETLTIFYQDGSVSEIEYAKFAEMSESKAKLVSLPTADALARRLDALEERFERAKSFTDKEKQMSATNAAFHECAVMIRMTREHRDFRAQIVEIIERYLEGTMGKGARNHLRTALTFVGDLTAYWWLADASNHGDKRLEKMFPSVGVQKQGHSPLRQGRDETPEERQKKRRAYEARRNHNRAERHKPENRPVGMGGGGSDPHGRGKKGKKDGKKK